MPRNKIAVTVGTRPEIIKMQPIIKELQTRNAFELLFVHTGQHYDRNMSDVFIEELELSQPDIFLNVKSPSPGTQMARIIGRFERTLRKEQPDMVLVLGDTNSAFGCAVAASKMNILVGHIEAGCRSFDRSMPEEINRVSIADLAEFHFAPTETCVRNLLNEGILKDHVFLTGHPIVDLLQKVKNKISSDAIKQFGLKEKEYCFVTVHRDGNITDKRRLSDILEALSDIASFLRVIFPLHPHTYKCIRKFNLERRLKNLNPVDPIGYFEALAVIKNAKIVLTDSGGVQQEAALLKTPCITVRPSTEWVETLNCGVNFLANSKEEIITMIKKVEDEYAEIEQRFKHVRSIFGKPSVSAKIADILESHLE